MPIRYSGKAASRSRLSPAVIRRYGLAMNGPVNINSRVVEALYFEALALAEAARRGFDELRAGTAAHARSNTVPTTEGRYDRAEDVEATCEALRTTTRVMHCLAWLLNYRAWFAGEISAVQLRRHGRLISHFPPSDRAILGRLPRDLAELVRDSERLYARIQRLDLAWRSDRPPTPGAIDRLRERLALSALRQDLGSESCAAQPQSPSCEYDRSDSR